MTTLIFGCSIPLKVLFYCIGEFCIQSFTLINHRVFLENKDDSRFQQHSKVMLNSLEHSVLFTYLGEARLYK